MWKEINIEDNMNYLFVSKYKDEDALKYKFENVIDAESHIADLIYMQGSKVKKLSNNVIEVRLDEDYTLLIIKQKEAQYDSRRN